jgi:DNA-binding CsgD family transcriptional regulator
MTPFATLGRSRRQSDLSRTIRSFGLTPRQAELVGQMCTGHTRIDIATAMGISESTVRSHLRPIFSKMNVSSPTQAVAAVLMRVLNGAGIDHVAP